MSKRLTLIPLATLFAALAPGAAHAAVSCSYTSFGVSQVKVTMSAPGDAARVSRAGDDAIQVNGSDCGLATVNNTSKVLWEDTSGGGTVATLDLSGGQFGPIIDFDYNAGAGADTFNVWGTAQNDAIRIGSDGLDAHVNLDAATDPVSDVDLQGVEIADLNGLGGNDVLDAGSHGDTGGYPFGGTLYMEGAAGDDSLTGGPGVQELTGGAGNDLITAGSGIATITPGTGDDTAVGGFSSKATVSYSDAPAGVHVDLSHGGSQDTGGSGSDNVSGFKVLMGSPYDDVLAGTKNAESIVAGNGDDTLIGRGGNDMLDGGAGANIASYADAPNGVAVALTYAAGFAQDTGAGLQRLYDISGLTGSAFDDVLTGDAGANRIDGGGGADTINAGDGPDTVLLRDGVADHADCGGASDTVDSDVAGLDVLTGCEQVAFAAFTPPADQPGGDQPGGGGGGAVADTTLTFRFTASKHQRLGKRGVVKGSLLCPDEACTGEVSSKLAIGRTARRAAHKTTPVAAGTAKVVKLKLSARALHRARVALRHGKRVSLKVTAVARDAAGNRQTVTRTIRLGA